MSTYSFMFFFFLTTAGLSALAILLVKNVFKAVLLLLTCLLSVAALYVLSFAEYLAVVQILIYSGGIMVVVIFGVMLTSKISGKPLVVNNANIFSGIVTAIVICVMMIMLFKNDLIINENISNPQFSISEIGIQFMTDYTLPFEIAGVILLMSLIGAAVTTSFRNQNKV
jgi:NADH:ubiquinone oxidoreductase subunit 6 (subunit J)